MYEIYPGLLWIGHALDVREPRALFDEGIAAVIDIAYEEPPALLPRQLVYCRFPLNDGGGNQPGILLQALSTSIDLLNAGTSTLIACSAGMSRSPTLAAFALAHHLSSDPESIVARIAESKALEVKPELWKDMLQAFGELDAFRGR